MTGDWRFDRELIGPRTTRITASIASEPLRFADVVQGWQNDRAVVDAWCRALAELPYQAVAWECPPLTEETVWERFECVAVDHPALARMPSEPETFAEHRSGAVDEVMVFRNLGGDSVLVAPEPVGDFPHLLAFCRAAARDHQRAFWRRVGEQVDQALGARPVWLSTAGMGVFWLHVRLDPRPKYYRHAPYRALPALRT